MGWSFDPEQAKKFEEIGKKVQEDYDKKQAAEAEQRKNTLSSVDNILKKHNITGKYLGMDEATGEAVFDVNGKKASLAKNDFGDFYKDLEASGFNKQSWINPTEEQEFKDIESKGNTFKGFDQSGNAIFQDTTGKLDVLGNKQTGGFYKYAQRMMGDKKFGTESFSDQNNKLGENILSPKPQQREQADTGSGIQQRNQYLAKTGGTTKQSESPMNKFQKDIQKEYAKTKQQTSEKLRKEYKPVQLNQTQPDFSMTSALTGMVKDKAQETAKNYANQQATQLRQDYVTNTSQPYVNQASQQVQAMTGIDPTKSLGQQATSKAAEQLGVDSKLITNPQEYAKQQALSQMSNVTGVDPSYLNMFNGNIQKNIENEAKKQAEQQALNYAASSVGVSPEMLSAVKMTLSGGGNTQDKGRLAGESAARAALLAYTGGLVSPESLQAASALNQKLTGKLDNAGIVGDIFKPSSKLTGKTLDFGSSALSDTMGVAGELGANTATDWKRALGKAGGGLQKITKGDISGGASDIAKGLFTNAYRQLVSNPAKAVGGVASSVGKALKKLCFTGKTPFLLETNLYKEARHLRVGDELKLGGKITSIAINLSDDVYELSGVQVTGSHAVFYKGKWIRVKDCPEASKVEGQFDVYSISTENHLLVTDGMVWSDYEEVDDDSASDAKNIKTLNSQVHANRMIKVFLKGQFNKK